MCNKKFQGDRAQQAEPLRFGKTAQGFSLILVLFLLVVVSLLAVSMAQLNRGGSTAVSQEILSVRALFAAESGAQVMAMRIFPMNSAGTCPATNITLTFPAAATGLNGCSATVSCASIIAAGRTVFTVGSTGVCGAGTETARRRIQVGLRSL